MTRFTEGRHPGEFIISEANFHRSRDAVIIGAEQGFEPGTVLAKLAKVSGVVATPSALAGNTGTATIAAGAPAVTTKVKDGRYKGIAVTATTVRWEDPAGKEIGTSTHGTEFAKGGVKFTITAGGTANVAGDEFYIDVAVDAEDVEFVAFDPTGTDGSEVPAGIAIYGATTGAGETTTISAIVRDAEANGHCIAWPSGITPSAKADAVQALAALGIIVRN